MAGLTAAEWGGESQLQARLHPEQEPGGSRASEPCRGWGGTEGTQNTPHPDQSLLGKL